MGCSRVLIELKSRFVPYLLGCGENLSLNRCLQSWVPLSSQDASATTLLAVQTCASIVQSWRIQVTQAEAFISMPSQGRKQIQVAMSSNTSIRITLDPGPPKPQYLSSLQSQTGDVLLLLVWPQEVCLDRDVRGRSLREDGRAFM